MTSIEILHYSSKITDGPIEEYIVLNTEKGVDASEYERPGFTLTGRYSLDGDQSLFALPLDRELSPE